MKQFLFIATLLLSTHSLVTKFPSSNQSFQSTQDVIENEKTITKSKILRLNKDIVISSTIPIRSEHVSLIGNRTTFLFQEHDSPNSEHPVSSPNQQSTTRTSSRSPHSNHHEGIATVFMFDVLNSTFCVEGVHALVNSDSKSICSVVGSFVRFSSSSITSSSDICPFVIRTSENGERCLGSTVMLCDVTHHSRSDSIAPFVGLANSHSSLVSSASADLSDLHNAEMEAIAVIGTGLWLESKDLIFGTGPLFSFGMNEHVSCLGPSGCPLRMETHLLSSTLVNVSSSSSAFSPSKQLFGSEVRQLVVGGCVSQSTNHDSGTGMMSPNLGGNLKCLNTSFSSCIRDQNAGASFQNRNFTQDSEPGRFDDPNASATVSFECCTFLEMSFSGGWNEGAAAIFLSETNAQLSVRNSYFHTCRCEGGWESGGAIHFQCKSAFYARDIDLYHVTFTDCYAGQNGVCVYAYDASRAEVIVSEGGSNRTEECGSFSTSCGSIGIGWKCGTEEEGSNDVILLIHTSARFGTQIHIGQRTLEMRSLFEGEGRVDVEEGVRWEGKEEGVVVVAGGWLQMLALTLRLPRPSLVGEAKTASVVVSGFGECVLDGVRVVESWEGEGVGMGMVLWSGGSLRLTQNEMKSIWMESNVSLVKCSSSSTEVTLEMSDCMFIEVETRNAELVAFSSTLASS